VSELDANAILRLPGLDSDRDPVRTVEIGGLPVRVEVVRSTRRHRTVSARQRGEVLRVAIPATMSLRQEDRWVREMAKRHVRTLASATIDLDARARVLSRRYDLPHATSVRWLDMESQWGSCTMAEGSIRIASRVASFPDWVLDYLLVHELAHLVHGDHSPAFWEIVARYPRAERARGYLIAKGDDEE
jgi:predicted metal-dependent hydrolase